MPQLLSHRRIVTRSCWSPLTVSRSFKWTCRPDCFSPLVTVTSSTNWLKNCASCRRRVNENSDMIGGPIYVPTLLFHPRMLGCVKEWSDKWLSWQFLFEIEQVHHVTRVHPKFILRQGDPEVIIICECFYSLTRAFRVICFITMNQCDPSRIRFLWRLHSGQYQTPMGGSVRPTHSRWNHS